jgi:hypothetical protein
MELMYKCVVYVGLTLVAAIVCLAILFAKKGKDNFSGGVRASNTSHIKSTAIYKKIQNYYRVIRTIIIIGLIGSMVASLLLVARPFKTEDVETGVKKRDIIICMDVSYSLYDLNLELVDYLKQVVKGLAGDRMGISIFNTSSVTYVPLTDDYDYVVEKLDELTHYFEMQKELYDDIINYYEYIDDMPDDVQARYYELREMLSYYDAGTLHNNSVKGSSLIGEGLGTALYSFPYINDSERTRVIIMSTDNQNNAFTREIMNLSEASDYCKKNKVTVFGIFPSEEDFYKPDNYDYRACKKEFENAVNKTGGQLYVRTPSQPVSAIIKAIQKQEVMTVNMVVSRETTDVPQKAFLALFMCLILFTGAGLVLQK